MAEAEQILEEAAAKEPVEVVEEPVLVTASVEK